MANIRARIPDLKIILFVCLFFISGMRLVNYMNQKHKEQKCEF